MNTYEYQAARLLKSYGVAVPDGVVVDSPDQVADALARIPDLGGYVVKAQVHTGGRGKAGGIRFSPDRDGAAEQARAMLGMKLVTAQTGPAGVQVERVMVVERIPLRSELYLGLLVDRRRGWLQFLGSRHGGMDIEAVAREHPSEVVAVAVDPVFGLRPFHVRRMASALGVPGGGALMRQLQQVMEGMHRLFWQKDATLVEINPLGVAGGHDSQEMLVAVDAKVVLDDSALWRQREMVALGLEGEGAGCGGGDGEVERQGFSYVRLDGNIGCLVNGAGLAMATMDIIKHFGGEPANFLDVGGSADADKVASAFRLILESPQVEGILVNIFGGIMQCDVLARGITAAWQQVAGREASAVPLVVRLDGTSASEGRRILAEASLPIVSADSLSEAAERIVQLVEERRHGHSR